MSENGQNSGPKEQNRNQSGDGNKKRRRRRRPGNRPKGEQQADGAGPNQQQSKRPPQREGGQGGGAKSSNSRRRRGGSGNSGNSGNRGSNASGRKPNRLSNIESLLNKYENLKEQYLIARSKYYHHFHRAGGAQLKKIKNHYLRSLEQLQRFNLSLSEYQQRRFAEAYDPAPCDTTYSESLNMPEVTTEQTESEPTVVPTPTHPSKAHDPHMTSDQLKRETFLGDQEESVGTMEDYQQFREGRE
ncbi:MAG: hypothetical protein HN353_11935 [Bdellovibrionales bacterium]|jgi:hypothetical protein|nr:hypothetical protein [Bdellovibrionales bacterium]MBT3527487.1 hypothetical protein [Bdellovibrionales bacterium]MBT7669905.1 hypothetical protein [Bdellovibrionales bacterium]MBT7766063.1 hypothetical protein [Bdellovibrionales bacterium]